MGAVRSVASLVRHAGGAATEAVLIAALIGLIALLLSPVYAPARFLTSSDEAAAAKNVAPYSTIEMASGTARLAAGGSLARGSSVEFTTEVYGLKGTEYPMVIVDCFADDGTLLYRQLDHPNATFVLGGGSSLWWQLDPSPSATCFARLYSYGGKTKGGYDVIRELTDPSLPKLSFHADG